MNHALLLNKCLFNFKKLHITIFFRRNSAGGRRNKYSDTLNLPKTLFPLSMRDAARREESVHETCNFDKLYTWQQQNNKGEEFILHDGPPYANGIPHVGHVINKILKDITTRYHVLKGRKVHYVPGWDCHGLPIELRALKDRSHQTLTPLQIRSKARKFAVSSIKSQMAGFRRWGVMADWQQQCYYTFNPDYEAKQLDVFFNMFEKDLIYIDVMPVYWSPSSQTALAESELEYNAEHVSTSIYVRCQVAQLSSTLRKILDNKGPLYAVIWTTTPWTIPANQAISFNNEISYLILEDRTSNELFICEDSFKDRLDGILKSNLQVVSTVKGSDLTDMTYLHPIYGEKLPCLHGNHVTAGKGTGLVHTAPAHGHEDFQLAKQYGLQVKTLLDDACVYKTEAGPALQGKEIGPEAENTVLSLLGNAVIHKEDFTHSYPYDWRTKKPVIIRASRQWFINTTSLKTKALEALQNVDITPASSEDGMLHQLVERPHWCISRQRVWGVPIPVFYNKVTGQPLLNRVTFEHVRSLIAQHGSDCWWIMTDQELLPQDLLSQHGLGNTEDFMRGQDILDIWFDSGTSWASVIGEGKQADVYMEGIDQFRGWFQSSLLTSVAVQDRAPYKQLVVHGFVMDEEGKKMSKSLGNVVDPDVVINGGKDKSQPAYGADVLRWWAAQTSLQSHSTIGASKLNRALEEMFELRKTMRFLLGNISVESSEELVQYGDLLTQDKFMLHKLHTVFSKIPEMYEKYQFHKVLQTIDKFCNEDISRFYSSMIKDRCYCSCTRGLPRQSTLTTQFHLLDTMVKTLAPIVPHLAEDLYQHYPPSRHKGVDSLFKTGWYTLPEEWNNEDLVDLFEPVIDINVHLRDIIAQEPSMEFDVLVYSSSLLHSKLKELQPEPVSVDSPLCEIFQTASTSLTDQPLSDISLEDVLTVNGFCNVHMKDGYKSPEKYLLVLSDTDKFICERCRRFTSSKAKTPCDRCLGVMAEGWK